jgi:hypothetical protein
MPFAKKILVICIFLLGDLVSTYRWHYPNSLLTQVYDVLNDSPIADTTCTLFQIKDSTAARSWKDDIVIRDLRASLLLDHHCDQCRCFERASPWPPTHLAARRTQPILLANTKLAQVFPVVER